MVKRLISFILVLLSFVGSARSQITTYIIEKAPFSSDTYDEYCPVYYRNGIVFCSNRNNKLFSYSNNQNKGLFKIDFVDTTGKVKWQSAKLFSKSLKSNFNDGPVTFNLKRDTIYYSRNQKIEGKIRDNSNPRNTLGIFLAVLENNKWSKIREFRFNNEYFNITTPCLSPDGEKLYFASDKPGGYGGSDLYYCQRKNDYWDNPVNLGPVINTKGNESYPFVNISGELFFSSDGHPGLGGKDIFFSKFSGNSWLTPVRLDPPINSKYDDFGIVTDSLMNSGYFSSNRNKSIDIFSFKTNSPQIFYIDFQKENQYCFIFKDTESIKIDTLKLRYEWDFGDTQKAAGPIADHCFREPGKFDIRLNLIDRTTNKLFFSKLGYDLELREYVQPYISSIDLVSRGDSIKFDASRSNLPGFKIVSYLWDFEDGARLQGERVQHAFSDTGSFNVNLRLTLKSDISGNISNRDISKKIKVFADSQGKDNYLASNSSVNPDNHDIRKYDNAIIETKYSAEEVANKDILFGVVILSSKTKTVVSSNYFRNLPKNYTIIEMFDQKDSTYNYISDRQMSLMATYPAYREMIAAGFKNTFIKLYDIGDPVEREIYKLIKTFGTYADNYFDNYGRLNSSAYLLLDQIVKILNKYPETKLEIAVYTDLSDYPDFSQNKAQSMVNYLTNRGISSKRLAAKGYGSSRPVGLDRTEQDKRLNRRIGFSIINK